MNKTNTKIAVDGLVQLIISGLEENNNIYTQPNKSYGGEYFEEKVFGVDEYGNEFLMIIPKAIYPMSKRVHKNISDPKENFNLCIDEFREIITKQFINNENLFISVYKNLIDMI